MLPWRRTDWTLPDWTGRAWTLEHNPRHSRQINAACDRHIERFPHELVEVELDTAAIMDLNKQLARLDRIERRNAA